MEIIPSEMVIHAWHHLLSSGYRRLTINIYQLSHNFCRLIRTTKTPIILKKNNLILLKTSSNRRFSMTENQSPRFMLMFTIGPVQSFIEAARKTEDLWMGSYILSYLVATAMEKVQSDGVEIIYPAIGTESPFKFWKKNFATPSFPNLFLAIGDGVKVSQDSLVERAGKAEDAAKSEFESMAKRVLDEAFKASLPWHGTYVQEIYNRQIPDFFDIYWVITEEKTEEEYGKWYARTAGNLAAIKNCRTFKQMSEFGRKCSLDGIREILHKKENESIDDAMEWWDDFAERKRQFCRPKEALCAVSLTKRMGMHYLKEHSKFSEEFGDDPPQFPSTSEVATAAFKEQLRCKCIVLGIYTDFVKEVKKLKDRNGNPADIPKISPLPKSSDFLQRENNIDGEWLYEETYNDSYLERYYNIDAKKEKTQIQIQTCKKLRSKLVEQLEGEPGKYYAAIALDGDNMGEKNREAKDKEEHAKRSNQLMKYANKVRRTVEEKHLGKLTYAGGDDLLALANLNDLLPILKKLRKRFPKFTRASAGVCIAHHKMPLTDVIRHARRMEKEAKKVDRKDALGIALYKHSGNVSQVVTKWEHKNSDGCKLNVIDIGKNLVNLLENDEISKRFLYTFRDAFAKLIGDDKNLMIELPSELVDKEFKRIIGRAYKTKGQELDKRSQRTVNQTLDIWTNFNTFTEYINFLEIITFISRESK
ncbi:type III-B CRISPR-associated protein Cas10/Cmr2 [Candidatus Poribacteria bacterium]|nr:MAG: type III-B CRISPR-associated protein Cas10/Cmr2 [Candidatus Poribacteria bacterium]